MALACSYVGPALAFRRPECDEPAGGDFGKADPQCASPTCEQATHSIRIAHRQAGQRFRPMGQAVRWARLAGQANRAEEEGIE
jgi:hypothetical protein